MSIKQMNRVLTGVNIVGEIEREGVLPPSISLVARWWDEKIEGEWGLYSL